ncbi:MAG: hypothetical protein LUG60_10520 [Erysipelotrichaceae bacterium]|nr:hypothetical protein [Erysipelotrichaceae bacterium]
MDTRIALKNNTLLKFNQYNQYIINKEIGRGATSIVYDASYTNNTGNKKTVRIKEVLTRQWVIETSGSA